MNIFKASYQELNGENPTLKMEDKKPCDYLFTFIGIGGTILTILIALVCTNVKL